MKTDCWVWRYELKAANALNAATARTRYPGALIRVGSGYGCLHPWPELGDPSLEDCLLDLAGARRFPLVRRALECARVDGEAREAGKSLFDGVVVPRSHATLPFLSEQAVEEAVGRGFEVVKVKAGRDLRSELKRIRELSSRWPELHWRIDFNGLGDLDSLVSEFSCWKKDDIQKIDFLEDPLRYDREQWRLLRKRIPLSLANDRAAFEDGGESEVLIWKPALEVIPSLLDQRIVATSYLDHPLGQCFAAWEAGRAGVTEVCGLQTHDVFQKNAFAEQLGAPGPGWICPEGSGLGFDGILKSLSWSGC